jgi:HK97 gp10 family phage protein
MGVTYKMEGLAELQAKLSTLPKRLARKVLRPALQDAGAIIQQEAGVQAPRATGKLTTHIVNEVILHSDLSGEIHVGPAKDAFYGLFSELGTAPHEEASPKGTKPYTHPGEPAHPWLRPAFETKGPEALEALAQNIRDGLAEVVREQ